MHLQRANPDDHCDGGPGRLHRDPGEPGAAGTAEWSGDVKGFGQRFASRYGQFTIQSSITAAGNWALGYEPRFGRGFISGVFSVALAALGFGGVLCLRFPSFLTTPDARALFNQLPALVSAGDKGMPALSNVLHGLDPTLGSVGPFLQQLNLRRMLRNLRAHDHWEAQKVTVTRGLYSCPDAEFVGSASMSSRVQVGSAG